MSSAELSKTEISASKVDKASILPKNLLMCALTLQEHKVKSQDTADAQVERSTGLDTSRVKFKQLSAEITV